MKIGRVNGVFFFYTHACGWDMGNLVPEWKSDRKSHNPKWNSSSVRTSIKQCTKDISLSSFHHFYFVSGMSAVQIPSWKLILLA